MVNSNIVNPIHLLIHISPKQTPVISSSATNVPTCNDNFNSSYKDVVHVEDIMKTSEPNVQNDIVNLLSSFSADVKNYFVKLNSLIDHVHNRDRHMKQLEHEES